MRAATEFRIDAIEARFELALGEQKAAQYRTPGGEALVGTPEREVLPAFSF